jgi:hypothetical protein
MTSQRCASPGDDGQRAPVLPRYPVYIPSKGRSDTGYTLQFLQRDGVPHYLVVEPPEAEAYRVRFGAAHVLVLPWSGDDARRRSFCAERGIENGGLVAARNWIWEHALGLGTLRHWQIDDNIMGVRRWYGGKRLRCASGVAFAATEDFVDRYENVALAGLNYTMFAHQEGKQPRDPFWLNVHVYSCSLILNDLPYRHRLVYNDDTDFCLQVLSGGWCTVLLNAFTVDKIRTMVVRGGNTDALYRGDGRLRMARSLERMWPGVVRTDRRWKRPQHVVKDSWKRFDTPLKLKPGIDLSRLEPNEYGMKLVQVKPEVKSAALRQLLAEQEQNSRQSRASSS